MPPAPRLLIGILLFAVGAGAIGPVLRGQTGGTVPSTAERGPSAAGRVRTDLFATLDGRPVTDLAAGDVQVLEDGVPQTLQRIELSRSADGGTPLSVVVFVDSLHTSLPYSQPARTELTRALETSLRPGDRVALLSPELPASELRFGTVAEAVSALQQPEWSWVRRTAEVTDPKEALYDSCFERLRNGADIAGEMKARRRERASLDALDDLVERLDDQNLDRSVVIVASEGWRLFGPNEGLARPRPSTDGVETPFGRFGGRRPAQPRVSGVSSVECEADLRSLASRDDTRRLRELSDTANRARVTFVPVTVAGLGEAGTDNRGASGARAGRETPASPRVQEAGWDSLQFLASNTGSSATTSPNPPDGFLARLGAEAGPFYVLEYQPTNSSLDGRYRQLTARTSRPGVTLRVRRGYRGATADEVLGGERRRGRAGRADAAPPVPAPSAAPSFRVRTAAWAETTGASFWVIGELDARLKRELAWTAMVQAQVTVVAGDGREVLARRVTVAPTDSSFIIRVPESGAVEEGDYAVRVSVSPEADPRIVLTDTSRVALGRAPRAVSEPLTWRRGPFTGPRFVRTAAARFQRQERIRLEFATRLDTSLRARLVDREGNPLQVPVEASIRPDDGDPTLRWLVAEVALAPLAPGQYAIEVTTSDGATHDFSFNVVP